MKLVEKLCRLLVKVGLPHKHKFNLKDLPKKERIQPLNIPKWGEAKEGRFIPCLICDCLVFVEAK